jgi:hypothetical protein
MGRNMRKAIKEGWKLLSIARNFRFFKAVACQGDVSFQV